MPYKNRTELINELHEIANEPNERTYHFSKCEKGKKCEIFYVKESELTDQQKAVLASRVMEYYYSMPREVQQIVEAQIGG